MTGDSSNIFASAVAAIGCLIANFYSHLAPWLLLGAAENDERYRRIVSDGIRRRYDLDAELAILRQRDTKPEEFAAYNAFAESCKSDAKILLVREKAEREAEFAAAQKAAQSEGEVEAQAN